MPSPRVRPSRAARYRITEAGNLLHPWAPCALPGLSLPFPRLFSGRISGDSSGGKSGKVTKLVDSLNKVCVLVHLGLFNKTLQTEWLKPLSMISPVLEAGEPQIKAGRSRFPRGLHPWCAGGHLPLCLHITERGQVLASPYKGIML